MTLPLRIRQLALTAHVTFSLGWSGAVASFLVLAVIGLSSRDAQVVRSVYIGMDLISWFVIVPLSFASPLSGIVQSLGTPWGLFRHYWVLIKFLITIPSTVFLMFHMQLISRLADVATATTMPSADPGNVRLQLAVDAGAALLVLLVATTLAVYKPKGMTRYGALKWHEKHGASASGIPGASQ